MALTPNRSRAKRSPFSSLADQLYPGDQPGPAAEEPEQDGPEQDGTDELDDAPEKNSGNSTPMSDMADIVYPPDAEGEDESQGPAEDQEDEGGENDGPDDDGQGENGPAAQSGANRLHAVLGMLGVHPSGKEGDKESEGAAKLEAGVRKAIADAEASKGGPLTPDEEQNITGEYIANHAMKWLPVRKHDPDQVARAMWDAAGKIYDSSCSKTLRKKFEAAGGNAKDEKGGYPPAGKDWGPTLKRNGYEEVSMENYQPQNGDIRVISGVPPKDPKHPKDVELWGHVQVYNAEHKQWVSEVKGDSIPPRSKEGHATITVYRFNPF